MRSSRWTTGASFSFVVDETQTGEYGVCICITEKRGKVRWMKVDGETTEVQPGERRGV